MKKKNDTNNFTVKRKINIKSMILILTLFIAFTIFVFLMLSIIIKKSASPDLNELERLWDTQSYQAVYNMSEIILLDNPFNNVALTYKGYSAFYLALSEIDSINVHMFIDVAINSLRLALIDANSDVKPQIEYILGKTYFHKNVFSAYHYYADLAILYLNNALINGYEATDIYEYLGLSYATLNMVNESITAFTEALLVNDSDVLQLAIAEQYYKAGQINSALPYLYQIKNTSTDELFVLKCSNLMGKIYIDQENYAEAQKEFETILLKDPNFADAYYGLGIIYEKQGDLIKARDQWRKTLKIQVNHPGALQKMGL